MPEEEKKKARRACARRAESGEEFHGGDTEKGEVHIAKNPPFERVRFVGRDLFTLL
jgi:hypothetical protein